MSDASDASRVSDIARNAQTAIVAHAREFVDLAVEEFVNDHGHTELTALQEIAVQGYFHALLFANMLDADAKERLKDLPLVQVVPAPSSLSA